MNKSVFALSTALSILAFTPAFAQETAPAPAAQVDCSQAVNANDPACVNQNNNNATTGQSGTTMDQNSNAATSTTTTDQNNATTTTDQNNATTTTGQSGTATTTDTTGSTAPVDPAANDATTTMSGNSLIVPADRVNGMQFITASDFIGKRVYDTNGENIGEVNDMILSAEGDTRAIILGVGGFLGIGEKDVAVSVDAVKIVQDGDSQRLVVEATKEMLENAPTYDRNTRGYAESGANAPATTGTGTTTTTTEQPPAQPAQ
jgi:sporulation protein YlmC with PRC-barrel domain